MPQEETTPTHPSGPGAPDLNTARVWLLCALVILLEGFDLQAAGVSAPRLAPAFHLRPVQLGWFLGASSAGIFLSSALGAHGLPWLLAARFCTGLGLGLAMPAVIALASDHSPDHLKKRAVGFIYCAIPLGALLSSAVLQSRWSGSDWRPVFLVGGLAPVLVAPLLLLLLPGASPATPGAGLRAGAPGLFRDGLFGRDHAAVTACLWLGTFGTLLVVYLLLGWMPSLLIALGLPRGQVQSVQMAFNLGASLGAAASGILLDRKFLVATPVVNYLGLAACLALLGLVPVGFHGALALAAGIGATATCGQAAIFALAPLCYSPGVRTTGVGATVSAGRFGTIAGPLLAGSLLGVGRSAADVLLVLIPITLISGLFVVGVARILGGQGERVGAIG